MRSEPKQADSSCLGSIIFNIINSYAFCHILLKEITQVGESETIRVIENNLIGLVVNELAKKNQQFDELYIHAYNGSNHWGFNWFIINNGNRLEPSEALGKRKAGSLSKQGSMAAYSMNDFCRQNGFKAPVNIYLKCYVRNGANCMEDSVDNDDFPSVPEFDNALDKWYESRKS